MESGTIKYCLPINQNSSSYFCAAPKTGRRISFTGWIVKCIAQAVSEHKHIHALRKGKREIITFDDVDVTIIIERETDTGEKLPMPYIIRKANEKTVMAIHEEIRVAQRLG